MAYRTVLLDLDHTLLDSDSSEATAFATTLTSAGIEPNNDHFPTYDRINKGLWAAVERGETTPNEVKLRRWELFVEQSGANADPDALATGFVGGLGQFGELFAGARELLEALSERATLALVTNGLSSVQRARIDRLDLEPFFAAIAISGELGVAKPDKAFMDVVFAELGEPDPSTTVIVGDSLTSDMAAGHNYGISTCWYNPADRAARSPKPRYIAKTFRDVMAVVDGTGIS